MPDTDRLSYDSAASAEAQGNLTGVVTRLETVIDQRDIAVRQAMADFAADGVSDEYHVAERRWDRSAREVRSMLALLRRTLADNDVTARRTQSRARTAVDGLM